MDASEEAESVHFRKRKRVKAAECVDILYECRRICCLCYGLEGDGSEKEGQIAHLDRSPDNDSPENLAYLCLPHHNKYDSIPRQTKRLTEGEVRRYKALLLVAIESGALPQTAKNPKPKSGKKLKKKMEEFVRSRISTLQERAPCLAIHVLPKVSFEPEFLLDLFQVSLLRPTETLSHWIYPLYPPHYGRPVCRPNADGYRIEIEAEGATGSLQIFHNGSLEYVDDGKHWLESPANLHRLMDAFTNMWNTPEGPVTNLCRLLRLPELLGVPFGPTSLVASLLGWSLGRSESGSPIILPNLNIDDPANPSKEKLQLLFARIFSEAERRPFQQYERSLQKVLAIPEPAAFQQNWL